MIDAVVGMHPPVRLFQHLHNGFEIGIMAGLCRRQIFVNVLNVCVTHFTSTVRLRTLIFAFSVDTGQI
jgi:hypothetical protein